jgi:hypothetical protein
MTGQKIMTDKTGAAATFFHGPFKGIGTTCRGTILIYGTPLLHQKRTGIPLFICHIQHDRRKIRM